MCKSSILVYYQILDLIMCWLGYYRNRNRHKFFFLSSRIKMDLSHLSALRYKHGKKSMEIIFLKKKNERKGFLLTKKDGILEDIQNMYPLDAWKFFESKIKSEKHFHFVDGNDLQKIVSFDDSFDNFGVFQEYTMLNRIKQRLLP